MVVLLDLTDMRFGKLTVVSRVIDKSKIVKWLCICDCGNKKIVVGRNLRENKTKSCGCLRVERGKYIMSLINDNYHGYAGTPTYESWRSMKWKL